MNYDSLKDTQSGLGTGAVTVMDKSTHIVKAIARFAHVSIFPLSPSPSVYPATSSILATDPLPAPRRRCTPLHFDVVLPSPSPRRIVTSDFIPLQLYQHRCCGQWMPRGEGTTWMMNMTDRFASGQGHAREIDMLLELTDQVEGHSICALGDEIGRAHV